MSLTRTLSFFLFITIVHFDARSQPGNTGTAELKGALTDSLTSKPIPFASVSLFFPDGQKYRVQSSEQGLFSFKNLLPGIYSLSASYVGYRNKILNGISLKAGEMLNAGRISMVSDSKILEGVAVTAKASLIQDKGDRIVYNAENDISNSGGTAIDVLRKTPMLSVDGTGNVQMSGSSSIKVLINGKASPVMIHNIADALKMMPASTIKSVEVITSPSAKFDAEGAGGIINIITKKNLGGANGSLSAAAGNMTRNINAGYNVKGAKFGTSISGYYGEYLQKGYSSVERNNNTSSTNGGTLFQNASYKYTDRGWNGDIGITYDADSLNLFSLSLSNWSEVEPNNSSLLVSKSFAGDTETYRQELDYKNPFGNVSVNLAYTRQFKKPKQELVFLSQYSTTYDDYNYTSNRYTLTGDKEFYREISQNKSNSDEWTVQTDYSYPFGSAGNKMLESGAKVIIRKVNSDYTVQTSEAINIDKQADRPELSDIFDYTQRVLSAYTSLKLNNKSGWMLTAGLRLEHTLMEGDFSSASAAFKNDYFNLIPSISASRKMNGKHTLRASYTQRITRPQVWFLNPYLISADPNNLSTGNPELMPEVIHSWLFGYGITGKNGFLFNTSLYWRQAGNAIQIINTVNGEGISLSRPENAGKQRRQGFSVSLGSDITREWSFRTNGEIYYSLQSSPPADLKNNAWIYYTNINTTYKLPAKYTVQLYANYNSGRMWLQGRSNSNYWYSASVMKQFINDKASLTLNADNIFNKYIEQESNETATGFSSRKLSSTMNRAARLSLSWKFGKINEGRRREARKVVNDDASRR